MSEDYLNRITLGDSFKILPTLPDESVDLVVTDPPYFGMKTELYDSSIQTFSAYLTWYEGWVYEVDRVLKDTGSLYVFIPPLEFAETHLLIRKYFFQRQIISWIKRNVRVMQPTARTYFPKVEFIGFYTKHPKNFTWNRLIKKFGMQRACNFEIQATIYRNMKEGLNHPTQKPMRTVGKFIYASSNEGDVVLDPFCGVGTTCAAAKVLDRKYIGIEINAAYHRIANARLGEFSISDVHEDKPKGAIF